MRIPGQSLIRLLLFSLVLILFFSIPVFGQIYDLIMNGIKKILLAPEKREAIRKSEQAADHL